uniref:Polyketide synthase 12778 n=1 Tax=Alternaria oxytropis TaxID=570715 RepID=A0A5B9GDM0_9PLEO|nr:polyketide synthase 12778 [Alternaria oxytropis]
MKLTETNSEPIAIIGSACRFAGGVTSPSQLWELLKEPRDVLGTIPESRFHADGFYHPNGMYHGHTNVRSAYTLDEHPGTFCAKFFRTKPVEAQAVDPQQRVLLEVVYEGLESAGLSVQQLRGSKTAIYVGMMSNDYENMLVQDYDTLPMYHGTGTSRALAANRVSYFFDWKGPSFTLDTACSSSLYAVNLAIQALRAGDASLAVASGSNLLLGPNFFIFESKLNMLSPDSRSRMWDEGANGYARGEGVAVVILKTLRAALQDGDDIECIIRETSLNQDGATNGITMPSASAQVELIRDTYSKAGLDPILDRPQYFEAHGTGTLAGDPIEAEAIHTAFLDNRKNVQVPALDKERDPLYVGSIKTVLGHTESAAGVAGLLKASLALQNAMIPPNLHFTHLSPKIAPYYGGLHVPVVAIAWPAVGDGQPRRASVNSFGFGGANAHVILESFSPPEEGIVDERKGSVFGPYVFSAHTEISLVALLAAYSTFLGSKHAVSVSPRNLAWTLRSRRSAFPFKTALPAGSLSELKANIDGRLREYADDKSAVGNQPSVTQPRVLGIFTGQGAQYVRMGAELFEKSPLAQEILHNLEECLEQLPEEDRPTWSLTEEILAGPDRSRLSEAVISQPLCTAVQIVLVNLLRKAAVTFTSVVGHSSGEIAAAYAAGYLSARDAICIAYYRGLVGKLARSPNGRHIKGAMLAVGTSANDANDLLQEPEFCGRATIAAINSSSSISLSGDKDAIEELRVIYEEEKKFCRSLKVDMAYHSKHMLPCSDRYVHSLRRCNITVQNSRSANCVWYSTVYENSDMGSPDMTCALGDTYWSDNLTRPVLFSQGLRRALDADNINLVLEIGPHPALKGPTMQVIRGTLQTQLPYYGTLNRKANAIEAFSSAIGFLWSYQEIPETIDLDGYEEAVRDEKSGGSHDYTLVKSLPPYQWDHSKIYWHEPRQTRNMRHRTDSVHPLLGHICSNSGTHQISWRHLLRTGEIPWLTDHQIQGKPVFPAAGYISSMLEASSRLLLSGESGQLSSSIRLIEATNRVVRRAVLFDEADDTDEAGVEIIVSMSDIVREENGGKKTIRAQFTFSAATNKGADDIALIASGKVVVHLGHVSKELLHSKGSPPPNLVSVGQELFFGSLAKAGYGYSGPFRAASELKRCLGKGESSIDPASLASVQDEGLLVHPGILDSALQTLLLAFSYPGDGQLWSVFVPVRFDCIRVNPILCRSAWSDSNDAVPPSNSRTTVSGEVIDTGSFGFVGDVDICSGNNTAIQIQGVHVSPFTSASVADDENMFARMHWAKMNLESGDIAESTDSPTKEQRDLCLAAERMAVYYMRKFDVEIPDDHPARSDPTYGHYLNLCRHVTGLVEKGEHKYASKEWKNDTLEDVMVDCARFSDEIDIVIMRTIGDMMPQVFRGETSVLEHLFPTGLITDYYVHALGQRQSIKWIGRATAQMSHRYPKMDILEVGAGTGGATMSVLQHIGEDGFRSYTFTDVSPAFFEQARDDFKSREFGNRIIYRSLDISKDPVAQGFKPGSYDLIIASYVLHATPSLEKTMAGLRRLLRPGGFVVVGEITNLDLTRINFVFGTLSGMWTGIAEGRVLSPYVRIGKWDSVLKNTGFSGIDATTSDELADVYAASVFVSQAVDYEVNLLREPLSLSPLPVITDMIIVGGATDPMKRLVEELNNILSNWCATKITNFTSLADIPPQLLTSKSTVLSLTELDKPLFKYVTPAEWDGLREIVSSEKTLLYVTRNRRAGNPFANLSVGFLRNAKCEVQDLHMQSIDFEGGGDINPELIAKFLLSLQYSATQEIAWKGKKLWSVEPEIIMNTQGCGFIPRFESLSEANSRYNSARREVTKDVDPAQVSVVASTDNQSRLIFYEAPWSALAPSEEASSSLYKSVVKLQASHTLPWPIDTPFGPQFLSIGVEKSSGREHLSISESPASILRVQRMGTVVVPSGELQGSPGRLLLLVAANIWSATILGSMLSGQHLVVHNPSPVLATVLKHRAAEKRISVTFTSDDRVTARERSWVYTPSYMPRAQIKKCLLVTKISDCVVFSTPGGREEPPFLPCLPRHCRIRIVNLVIPSPVNVLSDSLILPEESDRKEALTNILSEALEYAKKDVVNFLEWEALDQIALLTPHELVSDKQQSLQRGILDILHWSQTTIPARVLRLDAGLLFKSHRTYWLVGLTSGLGLSICDWMIAHGARRIVLSSRNPKIESSWLQKHSGNGIVVRVVPCDITSKEAVDEVHTTISKDRELPPLGGVMNGAMVLRDIVIRNMSLEDLNSVLQPKVDGSLNLDIVLGSTKLDFFVMFSSMVNILGNIGQANYCAANAFMSGLAAQRRARGLAACVVNIGAVSGAGYITREMSDDGSYRLSLMAGLKKLSEVDVHQLLAEAIVNEIERPNPDDEPEISCALHSGDRSTFIPMWFEDPRFARFAPGTDGEEEGKGGSSVVDIASKSGGLSIKDRLALAHSTDDVKDVVKDASLCIIRGTLQMEGTDDDILMGMRSNHLGIDSLVAAHMRSWFLKHFQVSIPVLSILSGIIISDLVDQVVQKLPSKLVPKLELATPQNILPLTATRSDPMVSTPTKRNEAPPPRISPMTCNVEPSSPLEPPESYAYRDKTSTTRTHPLSSKQRTDLSFAQTMFWVVHSLVKDKSTLNHTVLFRLTGAHIQIENLRAAIQALGQRHEALRTCFYEKNGRVQQEVIEKSTLELEQHYITREDGALQEFENLQHYRYDLATGHVMRFILLTTQSPSLSYIVTGAHHIVIDGLCLPIFLRDIQAAYQNPSTASLLNAEGVKQYAEFATSQRAALASGAWNLDLTFWRQEFSTTPKELSLRRARVSVRKPLTDYRVHRYDLTIDASLVDRIRTVARARGATAFHYYLAAFRVLLYRLLFLGHDDDGNEIKSLSETDICIGIADANRKDENEWGSVGPYMNLLPLRFPPQPAQGSTASSTTTFEHILETARDKTLAALRHSAPSLEAILDDLRVDRTIDHAPLFQAFLDYRQGWHYKQTLLNCTAEMLIFEPGRTPYDLSLDIIDNSNSGWETVISMMGQSALYDPDDVAVFARCYRDILREFTDHPGKDVDNLDWSFCEYDVNRALELGRGQEFQTTWPGTLIDRVQSNARRYARKSAVVITDNSQKKLSLTYYQLWKNVTLISDELLQHGVSPGQHVAVYQQATADSISSMLAVMAIGATYIPMDPSHHIARLGMIVSDCLPAALLVDAKTCEQAHKIASELETVKAVIINVSKKLQNAGQTTTVDREILASVTEPAVILYTSGTTGTPKGVVLKHSSLAHEIELNATTYRINSSIVVLQQSACGFDMAVLQVFVALAHGGTLCIVPQHLRGDSVAISKAIVNFGVTFTCASPTEYISWLQYGSKEQLRRCTWRVAVSGGESATEALLKGFRELQKNDLRLFNCYGPTETTCCSTKVELDFRRECAYDAYRTIPVGPASPNESIYIVDEQMRLLPLGLPGEIIIGGVGIAVRYLNDELKTSKSFLPDVFASQDYTDKGFMTMYRTGDRGRLLPKGWVSVEGRIGQDTLIKLRGMRIDLQDIEKTILRSAPGGAILDVAACVRSDDGSSEFIVAHILFAPDNNMSPTERHAYLSHLLASLPLSRSMCPGILLPVEKLPMTSSGKLDRRAISQLPIMLPTRQTANTQYGDYDQLTETESKLRTLWKVLLYDNVLLNRMDINSSTNFFHVGGTSMLLLEMRAHIQRDFGIFTQLIQLFESSTLASMARLIERRSNGLETMTNNGASSTIINWEEEARLPQDLKDEICRYPRSGTTSHSQNQRLKVVLITGATGNLGRYILHLLLNNHRVKKVICVALRNIQQRISTGILPVPDSLSRLVYYSGDLRRPRLGLSEYDFASLAKEIDVVVHAGAEVSHAKTYETLRETNVGSVKELIKLCLPRLAKIHLISSGEIAMLGKSGEDNRILANKFESETIFREESVLANGVVPNNEDAMREGYAASKWVAERFLENACATVKGLPAWIHRPSGIIPPAANKSESATGNACGERDEREEVAAFYKRPDAPLLQSFLHYSLRLGIVPDSAGLSKGSLDLVKMEHVANEIVNAALLEDKHDYNSEGRKGEPIVYRNHFGDQEIPMENLREYLEGLAKAEGSAKMSFETVSMMEWTVRAQAAGLHPLLVSFFENVSREGRVFAWPKFAKGSHQCLV